MKGIIRNDRMIILLLEGIETWGMEKEKYVIYSSNQEQTEVVTAVSNLILLRQSLKYPTYLEEGE